MGKKQQQQRTKGNVRPSSSSQAAQLLASGGGAAGGFVGFGALSGDLGYVPSSLTEEADSTVDSDFRISLRKLSKRDSTTKIKALQELKELCKEKSEDEVKTILPFWPRIYAKTAVNHERRVREACQQTFEELVLRVRRNLAPHLKNIMGAWLVAQCDSYAPAASAAKAAFTAAFPPAKQTEALVFCKEEILSHIQDNLLVQTPTTLSDPKTTDPEDMQSKHQRLVAATLCALRTFLTLVPADQHQLLSDQYTVILEDPKFWKFAKHENVMIKSAFYAAVCGVCQGVPDLAQCYADKLCPVVLHNLDDSDPVLVSCLWEAVLFVLTTVEDCWKKVNPRKGVFPKLWNLLKYGGNGNAAIVYPNLLPFLSKIPEEVIGGHGFFIEFFNNMKLGLTQEKVAVSPSECAAIVRALMECLRYILVQSLGREPEGPKLQEFLIQDQWLTVVEASLAEESTSLSNSPLYHLSADLLNYLHKQESSDEETTKMQHIQCVLSMSWEKLDSVVSHHIDVVQEMKQLDKVTNLMKSFNNLSRSDKKHENKGARVKFADAEQEPTKKSGRTTKHSIPMVDVPVLAEGKPFKSLLSRTCAKCLKKAKQENSLAHLSVASDILNEYLGESLVVSVIDTIMSIRDSDNSTCGQCKKFCEHFVIPWLLESSSVATNMVASQVSLFVMTLQYLPSDQKKPVLNQLLQVCNETVMYHLTIELMKHNDPTYLQWMRSDLYSARLLVFVTSLCNESMKLRNDAGAQFDLDSCWKLLMAVISSRENEGPMVTNVTLEKIVNQIQTALPLSDQPMTKEEGDKCVTFVCDVLQKLLHAMQNCFSLQSTEDLLLELFKLSGYQDCNISEPALHKVNETWKTGVKMLVLQKGGHLIEDGFLVQACAFLKNQVFSCCNTVQRVKELSQLSHSLLVSVAEGCKEEAEESHGNSDGSLLNQPVVAAMVKQMQVPASPVVSRQWARGLIISNQMTFNIDDYNLDALSVMSSEDIKFALLTLYNSNVLQIILTKLTTSEACEEQYGSFPSVDFVKDLCVELLQASVICDSVLFKKTVTSPLSEVQKTSVALSENYLVLLQYLGDKGSLDILGSLLKRSFENGDLYTLTLKQLLKELGKLHSGFEMTKISESIENISPPTLATVQTVEAVLPYLSRTELVHIMDIHAAQLISCPTETITLPSGAIGSLSILSKALSLCGGVEEIEATPIGVLQELQAWRDQHEHLFAFDKPVNQLPSSVAIFNIQAVEFVRVLVIHLPNKMNDAHWDFVLCSLASWIQSLQDESSYQQSVVSQALLAASMRLLSAVAYCVTVVLPEHPGDFPANISTEWEEFFAQGIYSVLLPMFIRVADSTSELWQKDRNEVLLSDLSEAVCHCPLQQLLEHQLPARLVADQESNLPDHLQSLLNHLCQLLLSGSRAVRLAAYKMLLRVMPELPAYDQKENKDEDQESGRSPPYALLTVVNTSMALLQVVTAELTVEDHIDLPVDTDAYTCAIAYLLTWKLLLTFFKGSSSELRVEYAKYLRDAGAVDALLMNLFFLMPETPVVQLRDSLTSQPQSLKLASTKNLFAEPPNLDISGEADSNELQHLACAVYSRTLQDLPAIVRQWWNSLDRHTASVVEKFTSKYVSPILCSQEIQTVQTADVKLPDMNIKTRPAAREVVAVYSVDEVSMELVICMPQNYPLGLVTVECGKRVGVANTQWRNWMLQMTTFLAHQNGSIIDGLLLWKRNVDKRFEGVEDCMICFSVIHGTNCQLPKIMCKTCKKKFHSACLYKWFNTSNNSTCPLCRNLF